MTSAAFFWFALAILFGFVEASTVSLLTIWFACGSLAATLAAALGAPFWLQLTVFVLVSVGLLLGLRNLIRKRIAPKQTATNADSNIGRIGVVQTAIDNDAAAGSVKVGAMEWTARSADGCSIAAGTKVRVERIEGVKLIVLPAEATVTR